MTTFANATGNLLDADVDALVNTVNTVGVMGKGIALQFKNAFPANFRAYERAAKNGEVRLGQMFVYDAGQLTKPRWIINFPTKGHWRSRSRIKDIEVGLEDLRRVVQDLGITSIAVPPLGCGNGGLDWADVRPLIEHALSALDLDVQLFAPMGAPDAATMRVATARPSLTPAKAALVAVADRYDVLGLGTSLIELQKLMYFLQEAGEPLKLRYEAQRYGPYADNLRHVLKAMEGHHLRGFGDGSKRVREADPIEVLPGAAEEAAEALSDNDAVSDRIGRVLALAEGYSSPYGLELLATVHWAATHTGQPDDLGAVVRVVQSWNRRKARMFTKDHIAAAWNRLRSEGWIAKLPQPA
jgi:O-acetyl-ADP-ribose deacetylase (regulator of RNase III)